MDYVELLIQSYAVARTAHELGRMLVNLTVEKGHVYVEPGFIDKIAEFSEAMEKMIELKCVKGVSENDGRNIQTNQG